MTQLPDDDPSGGQHRGDLDAAGQPAQQGSDDDRAVPAAPAARPTGRRMRIKGRAAVRPGERDSRHYQGGGDGVQMRAAQHVDQDERIAPDQHEHPARRDRAAGPASERDRFFEIILSGDETEIHHLVTRAISTGAIGFAVGSGRRMLREAAEQLDLVPASRYRDSLSGLCQTLDGLIAQFER